MQTSQETVIHAGTQTPLFTADQLKVGAILTGIAMTHLWEILAIEGSHLSIVKLPKKPVCDTHTLTLTGRGHACPTCGMRRQDVKDFLPLKPEKARVHLITSRAPTEMPELFTVYGGITGAGTIKLYQLHAGGTGSTPDARVHSWNEPLPVFPVLHKLWSIPPRLRALSEATPSPVDPDNLLIEIIEI